MPISTTDQGLPRRILIGAALFSATLAVPPARADELPFALPPLRTVQVDGHAIAYYEAGTGPALLLVHGFSGSAALEWGRVIGPLSKRFRVIAPYQIGFGPSAQPDLPYDAKTFVTSLGGLMKALKIVRPTLVGESFGGWVVAQYAQAQGARTGGDPSLPEISRLVIVDGAVGIRPSDPRNINAPSINDPAVGALVGAFVRDRPKVDNDRTKARASPAIGGDQVELDVLARRKLPTLIIWGDGDQLLPLPIGRRLAAELPGARLAVIERCGHIPSVEQPEAFLRHLLDFA